MPTTEFTLEGLIEILREGAGVPEGSELDGMILDVTFEELGYDSLAMLETWGRIERDLRVQLGEDLPDGLTPRMLLDQVNRSLGRTAA